MTYLSIYPLTHLSSPVSQVIAPVLQKTAPHWCVIGKVVFHHGGPVQVTVSLGPHGALHMHRLLGSMAIHVNEVDPRVCMPCLIVGVAGGWVSCCVEHRMTSHDFCKDLGQLYKSACQRVTRKTSVLSLC